MKDLFGILEKDADQQTESVEKQHSSDKFTCLINSKRYLIERHEPTKPGKQQADELDNAPFWRLFIVEGGKPRRLKLLETDPLTLPDELLVRAEQTLDWAAGGLERSRTLAARLRPAISDDPL